MASLWTDVDFETGDLTQIDDESGNVVASQALVKEGSWAAESPMPTVTGAERIEKHFTFPGSNRIRWGFWWHPNSAVKIAGTDSQTAISRAQSGQVKLFLQIQSSPTTYLLQAQYSTSPSSGAIEVSNAWHFLELDYFRHASTGFLKFYIDGVEEWDSGTFDTTTVATFGQVHWGARVIGNRSWQADNPFYFDLLRGNDDGASLLPAGGMDKEFVAAVAGVGAATSSLSGVFGFTPSALSSSGAVAGQHAAEIPGQIFVIDHENITLPSSGQSGQDREFAASVSATGTLSSSFSVGLLPDAATPYDDGVNVDIEPVVSAEPSELTSHPFLMWSEDDGSATALRTKAADATKPNGNAWSGSEIYSAIKQAVDSEIASGANQYALMSIALCELVENDNSYAQDIYDILISRKNDDNWVNAEALPTTTGYDNNHPAAETLMHYAVGFDTIYDWIVANNPSQEIPLRNRIVLEVCRLYDALSNKGEVLDYGTWQLYKQYGQNHHVHALLGLMFGSNVLKNNVDADITQEYDNSGKNGFVGSGTNGRVEMAQIDTIRQWAKDELARLHYVKETFQDGVNHEGGWYSDFLEPSLYLPMAHVARRLNWDVLSPSRYLQRKIAWLIYNHRPTGRRHTSICPHGDSANDGYSFWNGAIGLLRYMASVYKADSAKTPIVEAACWYADQISNVAESLGGPQVINGRHLIFVSNTVYSVQVVLEFIGYDNTISPTSPDAQSTAWPKWRYFEDRGVSIIRENGFAQSGTIASFMCGEPWSKRHADFLRAVPVIWDATLSSRGGFRTDGPLNSHPLYSDQTDKANGDPGFPDDGLTNWGGHAHCDAGMAQFFDADADHFLAVQATGKKPTMDNGQGRDPEGKCSITVGDTAWGVDGQNSMRSKEWFDQEGGGNDNDDFGGEPAKNWRSDVYDLNNLAIVTRGENARIPFWHGQFAEAFHRNVNSGTSPITHTYQVDRMERFLFANLNRKSQLYIDVMRRDGASDVYNWHQCALDTPSRETGTDYVRAPIAPGSPNREMVYQVLAPSAWTFGTKTWASDTLNNAVDTFGTNQIHSFRVRSNSISAGTQHRFIVAAAPTTDFASDKLSASTSVDDGEITGVRVDYSDGTDLYFLNHSYAAMPGEKITFAGSGGPYDLNGMAAGIVFGQVGTSLADLVELLIVDGKYLAVQGGQQLIFTTADDTIKSMHVLINTSPGTVEISGRGFKSCEIFIGTGRTVTDVLLNGTAGLSHSYDTGTGILTI